MLTLQERMAAVFGDTPERGVQAEIARLCRKSKPTVSAWFNTPEKVSSISRSDAEIICARWSPKISPAWLAEGTLPKFVLADAGSNIAPAPIGARKIPLISDVQAGSWTDVVDSYAMGAGDDYLLTDLELSPGAFALKIKGRSMEPEFKEGDRVIIDPAVIPDPGDYVVAKNGEEAATFKKYRPRGMSESGEPVFELVPLNEDFETLRSDRVPIRIVGTMVEHRKYRRR